MLHAFTNELGEADAVLGGDHLGRLLADHDRGRVGVAADHGRHDASVRHPQPPNLLDPQPRINDIADPAAQPDIRMNYYDDPHDMRVMVAAIRRTMDIAAHWPGNRKLGALMVPPFLAEKHGYREGAEPSDALLEDFALHFSLTVYHPTSTCRIGDVVDPRLRVKQIGRLRVADANVMPAVIGGNTNAPAIMIGEKFSGCCGDRPHAKTQD